MDAEKRFRSMGVVLGNHKKLQWGLDHGHFRYLPHWMRHTMITTWNYIACRILGHDWIPEDLIVTSNKDVCYNCRATRSHQEWVE